MTQRQWRVTCLDLEKMSSADIEMHNDRYKENRIIGKFKLQKRNFAK